MKWVLALHVMFMVTWFAALFYLPRLFVYHAMSDDAVSNERFKIMERKLFHGIATPGAVLTSVFGFWMLGSYAWEAYSSFGWLHVKLFMVVLLVIYHVMCGKYLLDFKHDRNRRSHVFYRWFNEIPVVMLVVIIIMVIVRPF